MPNSENAQLKEMLERIVKKVENSPVLNGGWDKMVVTIDHIKEKQDISSEKMDILHDALYQPDDGFFARVASIEHETIAIKDKIVEHTEADEKFHETIELSLKEGKPSEDTARAVNKLQEIAGKDLEELNSVIKIRKTFEKMFWLIAAGTGSVIGKMLWDILMSHH
jgi:hypothetical protein